MILSKLINIGLVQRSGVFLVNVISIIIQNYFNLHLSNISDGFLLLMVLHRYLNYHFGDEFFSVSGRLIQLLNFTMSKPTIVAAKVPQHVKEQDWRRLKVLLSLESLLARKQPGCFVYNYVVMGC